MVSLDRFDGDCSCEDIGKSSYPDNFVEMTMIDQTYHMFIALKTKSNQRRR